METASSPLFGKVALVTGAARNIGRAVAERLARDGAKVALVDVDAAVEVTARELGHGADVIALRADVNSATDVDRCFHEVVARWQRLDILVNNAAITRGGVRHFLEGDEAWWDEVWRTGVFHLLHHDGNGGRRQQAGAGGFGWLRERSDETFSDRLRDGTPREPSASLLD